MIYSYPLNNRYILQWGLGYIIAGKFDLRHEILVMNRKKKLTNVDIIYVVISIVKYLGQELLTGQYPRIA